METNSLHCGDCLEIMQFIPDNSIHMILSDLPYGVSAAKWDSVIPLDLLWEQYRRILTKDGVAVLTATQPFTTTLINSNPKEFKYCWYWIKNQKTNFYHAKRMPLRQVEEILVFGGDIYNPQMSQGHEPTNSAIGSHSGTAYHGKKKRNYQGGSTERYPSNVLDFKCVDNYSRIHSAQKPLELFEYLIRTYSNEGDTILDNCAGSGTTGVACQNTGRNYVLIDIDPEICSQASNRLEENIRREA